MIFETKKVRSSEFGAVIFSEPITLNSELNSHAPWAPNHENDVQGGFKRNFVIKEEFMNGYQGKILVADLTAKVLG